MVRLVVLGEIAVVALLAASNLADNWAERIVLFTAALAGVAWFFANVLRPAARILTRTVSALEALEDLPSWREATDRRVRHVELGVGHIWSGQRAILRELGIEDKVRSQFSDPVTLEKFLADFLEEPKP